ncbi:MAG: FKBP-type peptidyl-prolyl cis-trans isomerase [Bacteroidales bacterium]
MNVEKNSVVSLTYTLRYDDINGEIIEEVDKTNPMNVLIGHELLLDKFEENLQGLKKGDLFEFALTEEEGYGLYDEEGVIRVPKAELMDGVPEEEREMLYEGNIVPIQDTEGTEYQAFITEIKDDIITLDFNHPLAGENLYFKGVVVGVREATKEEIKTENVTKF